MAARSRWWFGIPLALGLLLLARLVGVWAARLSHPYDLEWMEGGMLVHAWRIRHGLPLYPEPGPDWIPFIYPPGYASALAAVGGVVGVDYWPGRLISLAGALAAAVAAGFVVMRHADPRRAAVPEGVIAGLMFLGCYPESGGFYDLVRIDGLFIGLLAWAIALAFERGRGAVEVAGLLLASAFLVKQNGALFGVPLLALIVLREGWRAGVRFVAASAGPALAMTAYLQWTTDGRYLTYIVGVAASHPTVPSRVFPGTPWELGLALPVAAVVGVMWLGTRSVTGAGGVAALVATALGAAALGMPRPIGGLPIGIAVFRGMEATPWWAGAAAMVALGGGAAAMVAGGLSGGARRWRYWGGVGVAAASVVTSALMRGHHGGFLNVHMQLHWVVIVGFGLALAAWGDGVPGRTASVVGAACLQLGWQVMRLHPERLTPDAADRAVGDAVVAELRDAEEPILSPIAPWLAAQAGHPPGLHLISLWDVTQHRGTPFPAVDKAFRAAMRKGAWATVLDDGVRGKGAPSGAPGSTFGYGVRESYEVQVPLPGGPQDLLPLTGWRSRPRWVLGPKGHRAGECPSFDAPSVSGVVSAPEITEASGLVASRLAANLLWTHNDSGDSARIFAIDTTGALRATVTLRGAAATDVEDIAAGAGPDGKPSLFVADIGDNQHVRDAITVWRTPEPPARDAEVAAVPMVLRYPDGAHDAETLLVDPKTDSLYVLTKSHKGKTIVFRGSAVVDAPQTLERVGELTFGRGDLGGSERLTGGDIAPDGGTIVLRTYTSAFWFRRTGTVEDALRGRPCVVPMADEPQGESVAFGADGAAVWTLSEGSGQPLHRVSRRN
jgi:hypothetical protein